MALSRNYLLTQEIPLSEHSLIEIWDKTISWINSNQWELIDSIDNDYVRFKHVISSVRSYTVREIEIDFSLKEQKTISFNVFANSKYPDPSNALMYKKVVFDYLHLIELSPTDEVLREILSLDDINRLLWSELIGFTLFNVFTVINIIIGIKNDFLLGYIASVLSFTLSIPSIKKTFSFYTLKRRLY